MWFSLNVSCWTEPKHRSVDYFEDFQTHMTHYFVGIAKNRALAQWTLSYEFDLIDLETGQERYLRIHNGYFEGPNENVRGQKHGLFIWVTVEVFHFSQIWDSRMFFFSPFPFTHFLSHGTTYFITEKAAHKCRTFRSGPKCLWVFFFSFSPSSGLM